MTTRSTPSSSSTVLLVLILVVTFPIWFAIGASMVGIFIGLLGAAAGVISAIFGVLITILLLPFKILFGGGHHAWFPHFHFNGFLVIAVIVLLYLLLKKRK